MHVCVYVRACVCLSQHDMDEERLRSIRHASMVTLMRLDDIDCLVLVGYHNEEKRNVCMGAYHLSLPCLGLARRNVHVPYRPESARQGHSMFEAYRRASLIWDQFHD